MKEIENQYSGHKAAISFGVKLHDDGKITYHADYEALSKYYAYNSNGIHADTPEGLLNMLMEDE